MKTTVTVNAPEGEDPFSNYLTRPARAKVRLLMRLLSAVVGGGFVSRASSRPSVVAGKLYATSTAACSSVTSSGSCTVNGQALAATQHNATGTITPTTSGIDINDTVTINGYAFTAKATELISSGHFKADGTDAACCTSLAACINGSTSVLISGLFTATATATVVTVRAVTAGTAGNSYTFVSDDAQLAVSGSGTLTGGAAVGNNEFDYLGTNTQTATALTAALNASTTAIVSDHVKASNLAGVVTLAAVEVGDYVTVAGVKLTAVAATPTNSLTEFSQADTDTNDAVALKNLINAHPYLKEKVFASNSSGVLTIRQLPAAGTTGLPLSSSNGTRLAVTVTSSGLLAVQATVLVVSSHKGTAGNAVTLAGANGVTAGAARLAGGTDATLTF